MNKNHYEILGIHYNCTQEDIRKAYLKKARECHPDKNPYDTDEADRTFKSVSEAYENLSEVKLREDYDLQNGFRQYPESKRPIFTSGFQGSNPSFASASRASPPPSKRPTKLSSCTRCLRCLEGKRCFFASFMESNPFAYSPTGQDSSSRPFRNGGDFRLLVEVSLEEFYHGTVKVLGLDRYVMITLVEPNRKVSIFIYPGDSADRQYRFQNVMWDRYGNLGDVVVSTLAEKHDKFFRLGNDLEYRVPYNFWVSRQGEAMTVAGLDNRIIRFTCPTVADFYPTIVFLGAGMPVLGKTIKGNLTIHFTSDVVWPLA